MLGSPSVFVLQSQSAPGAPRPNLRCPAAGRVPVRVVRAGAAGSGCAMQGMPGQETPCVRGVLRASVLRDPPGRGGAGGWSVFLRQGSAGDEWLSATATISSVHWFTA